MSDGEKIRMELACCTSTLLADPVFVICGLSSDQKRDRADLERKARLIAAAPEMLALLEEILRSDEAAMDELTAIGVPYDGGLTSGQDMKIRALLARVRGEDAQPSQKQENQP